jgi:hypothetical protein
MTQFWVRRYGDTVSHCSFRCSTLSSTTFLGKWRTNHGRSRYTTLYSRSCPHSSSASSTSSCLPASSTATRSCTCSGRGTSSSPRPRSGCGSRTPCSIVWCVFEYDGCSQCRLTHIQVAFGFSIILWWGDLKLSNGLDSGQWFWGASLYMSVLLVVLGKAALISE